MVPAALGGRAAKSLTALQAAAAPTTWPTARARPWRSPPASSDPTRQSARPNADATERERPTLSTPFGSPYATSTPGLCTPRRACSERRAVSGPRMHPGSAPEATLKTPGYPWPMVKTGGMQCGVCRPKTAPFPGTGPSARRWEVVVVYWPCLRGDIRDFRFSSPVRLGESATESFTNESQTSSFPLPPHEALLDR